jgi:hypothetical protein
MFKLIRDLIYWCCGYFTSGYSSLIQQQEQGTSQIFQPTADYVMNSNPSFQQVKPPRQTFQQQVETVMMNEFERRQRQDVAGKFIFLSKAKRSPMKFLQSPYSDYSPYNRDMTSRSSIVALLCSRLARESCTGCVLSRHSFAMAIFLRVLDKVPIFEKEPSTVFFPFSDYSFHQHPSLAPDVRAIISHKEVVRIEMDCSRGDLYRYTVQYSFIMASRFKVNDSWLSQLTNGGLRVSEPTFALYSSDSRVPQHIIVSDKGKLWRVIGEKRISITKHPVKTWEDCEFRCARFSYDQNIVVVHINRHLVFINLETFETIVQIVGSDVTFHPRLPIFWTPASWNSNTRKEYPSRLWLINLSWTGAKPVAWGQNDLGRRLL